MTLSVFGLSLVSPSGKTAREHVFFPPANAPAPAPSAYVLADGSPFWINHLRIVLSQDPVERMFALGKLALDDTKPEPNALLYLVLPEPREGVSKDALDSLARRLGDAARASSVERFIGAAGAFQALGRLLALEAKGELSMATLLGVDSFFHIETVEAFVKKPPGPFSPEPLPFSEGAAALVLGASKERSRLGKPQFGEVLSSQTAMGRGKDDDDEPQDALALTTLVRNMKPAAPLHGVFGQGQCDSLRIREWEWAAARGGLVFHDDTLVGCLEADVGRLGAAAGVSALAHGIATFHHREKPESSHLMAWAIAKDGTRGLAVYKNAKSGASPVQKPLTATITAWREPGLLKSAEPFMEPSPEDEEMVFEEASFDVEEAFAPENDIASPLPSLAQEPKPPPSAQLDKARLRPLTAEGFSAEIVAFCAETLMMLGKTRAEVPMSAVPNAEGRIRANIDAIVATGPRALVDLRAFWIEMQKNPWSAFAGTLGALALDGNEALSLLEDAISAFPDDACLHASNTAEAFALCERADLLAHSRALFRSEMQQKRAVGLLVLGQKQALTTAELRESLRSASALVRYAALRACADQKAAMLHELADELRRLFAQDAASPEGQMAARLLALVGDSAIYGALAENAFLDRTPELAAELFLLRPDAAQVASIDAFFLRQPASSTMLSAVSRWGTPPMLERLIAALHDDALNETAAECLITMLGHENAPQERLSQSAWRNAITRARLEPNGRLRRGLPHSTATIANEISTVPLTRKELSLRIDEIRAKLGSTEPISLVGWWKETESSLAPLLAAARKGKG